MSVEDVKRSSGFLRGTLPEELADGADAFGHDNTVVLKFHGIYQQDDRDVRRERASQKLPLDYSCMVRASVPGGKLSAEQWQALDRVADLADGTMRLTTRQGVQFHVVHKGDLKDLVRGINLSLLTTIAACGDVVRNIMGSPWPDERQDVVEPLVAALVARFRPQTTSYWELWVDGEKAVTAQPAPLPHRGPKGRKRSVEPIYGDVYLPRKFKIAVAWPGDNSVDVHANDVGIVPTLSGGTVGDVTGYNVYVGGGLGMSHAREDDTYPLLAQPLGWVPPDRIVDVVEAVVTTQRDHGNREDRHRARLKYLVETRGIEWIRAEVGRRVGFTLDAPADLPPWVPEEYHGTRDGVIGLPVPSGKVADRDGVRLRTALRELTADGTVTQLRITARQDLLLFGIAPERVAEVEDRLRAHGVPLAGDVERAAPAGHRLPGAADVRTGPRGGRTGAPGPGGRAGEGPRRHRQRRRPDPPQHDRLPERLRPAVQRRDRHRRADQEDLRRLRRRGADRRPARRAHPRRRAPGPAPRRAGPGVRPLRPAERGVRRLVRRVVARRRRGDDRHVAPRTRRPPAQRGGRGVVSTVWLVGAGPGDPDLLTVKAARLLAEADVVVHDALVGDGVLDLVPASAELIDVGKRPGRPVPQELISTLLVELARGGRRVVRLKGGDPFVFGRGGEEALALLEAGIPFEVVPGVSSAVAAPAAAGVPVTHRGVAAAFTVVTGHRRAGEPDVDWRSLAKVGGTVVVLMGVAQRGVIAAELIAGGLDPATPVAAVRSATTDDEVVARCRLDDLATTPVDSPAVLVIGAVAALDLRPIVSDALRSR